MKPKLISNVFHLKTFNFHQTRILTFYRNFLNFYEIQLKTLTKYYLSKEPTKDNALKASEK